MLYGDGEADGYYSRELAQYGLGDAQLGLVPLAISAAKPASSVLSLAGKVVSQVPLVGGLFTKSTKDKNAGRAQTNTDLAARARAGDPAAWDQLAARSKPGALPYNMWQDAAAKLAGIPRPSGRPLVALAPAPSAAAPELPSILQPATSPTGPNAGAVVPFPSSGGQLPATPAEAAGGAPGYGGTPGFPMLPLLIGGGLLALLLTTGGRRGGGGNWE